MRETFLPFALLPFNFHGVGGGGRGKGYLRLLLTAAALLVCIPADRKASARDFCIVSLPPFNSSGLGGWAERGVDASLTSGTACLVCMPADQKGERAGSLFLLRICRSIFHGLGRGGETGVGDSYS